MPPTTTRSAGSHTYGTGRPVASEHLAAELARSKTELGDKLQALGKRWASYIRAPLLIDAAITVRKKYFQFLDISQFCGTRQQPVVMTDSIQKALAALRNAAFKFADHPLIEHAGPAQRKAISTYETGDKRVEASLDARLKRAKKDACHGDPDWLEELGWCLHEFLGEASILACAMNRRDLLPLTAPKNVPKHDSLAEHTDKFLKGAATRLNEARGRGDLSQERDVFKRVELLKEELAESKSPGFRIARIPLQSPDDPSGPPIGSISILTLAPLATVENPKHLRFASCMAQKYIGQALQSYALLTELASRPAPPPPPPPATMTGDSTTRIAAHLVLDIADSHLNGHRLHGRKHGWSVLAKGMNPMIERFRNEHRRQVKAIREESIGAVLRLPLLPSPPADNATVRAGKIRDGITLAMLRLQPRGVFVRGVEQSTSGKCKSKMYSISHSDEIAEILHPFRASDAFIAESVSRWLADVRSGDQSRVESHRTVEASSMPDAPMRQLAG